MSPHLHGPSLPPSYDAIRQINHVRALSGYSLPPSYDAIRQINHVRVLSAARSVGSAGPCVKAFPLLRPDREFPEPTREIPHQIGNYKIRKRPICFFVLCFGFCLRPQNLSPGSSWYFDGIRFGLSFGICFFVLCFWFLP